MSNKEKISAWFICPDCGRTDQFRVASKLHEIRGLGEEPLTTVYYDTVERVEYEDTKRKIILGKKVYDPRDGQMKVSNNPALVMHDLISDNKIIGVAMDAKYYKVIIEMANLCDEEVKFAT